METIKVPALPKAASVSGADMGRIDTCFPDALHNSDFPAGLKFAIVRLQWVDGDYDEGGAYWGRVKGDYIFRCYGVLEDEEVADFYVRCRTYKEAQAAVATSYPTAQVESVSDEFSNAYISAALWSTNDDAGASLDTRYSAADIDADSLAKMRSDCEHFQTGNADLLARYYGELPPSEWSHEAQAGHDLWLSRNGHGTGFFDRQVNKELADALQGKARAYGECNLYVGDDGRIYSD